MDNTDVKRKVVLIQKRFNPITGEKILRVKPKRSKPKKIRLATGRGKKTIGKILLARLVPFKFAMITGLNRKGINTLGLDFKNLVIQYHNNFSKNKPIPISQFINSLCFKISPSDTIYGDIETARNQTTILNVDSVVNEVIRIFKDAEMKYNVMQDQGLQPELMLTDEQLIQAKAVKLVKRKLIKEFKQDHFLKAGEFRKTLIWIAGIFLAIYLIKKL